MNDLSRIEAGLSMLPDPLAIMPVSSPLHATVTVPGSKSVTNRALVCASMAAGTSTLTGVLRSDDTDAMTAALASLGIDLARTDLPSGSATVVVQGSGGRLPSTQAVIDTGQSGTTSRFILPLLVLGSGTYEITADPQMQRRPMGESIDAVEALGAQVTPRGAVGHLPLSLTVGAASAATLKVAGDASSQFLSGLLMIGPCLPGGLTITLTTPLVSRPYVDLTLGVMASFGAIVEQPDDATFVVRPGGYVASTYSVEPDASAASYPLGAAAVCGGTVRVEGFGRHVRQGDAAFGDVLAQMGATLTRDDNATTITVTKGELRGGTFDFTHISDTAQTLAAIAPFASSAVTITGIGFIRHKEIDRVEAVATELRRAGIRVDVDPDGWTIHPGPVAASTFETYDDHRMAMSFALIGLATPGISIAGPRCVAKTFPGYWAMLDLIRSPISDR